MLKRKHLWWQELSKEEILEDVKNCDIAILPIGRNPSKVGVKRPKQLSFQGVYRFYQDETRLFVNDSIKKQIWVFDVLEDGTLSNKTLFAVTM